jgi:3-oxoacyl-[acyl-carrier-protein] synthase II
MLPRSDRVTRRRVAITGIGAVSALGGTAAETWDGLIAGRCGIRPVTLFDTEGLVARNAAEIAEVPRAAGLDRTLRKRSSRADRLAVAAAEEALRDAGIDRGAIDPSAAGVVLGAGAGGLFETEGYYLDRLARGPRRARVSRAWGFSPCATTDLLGAHLGFEGFTTTVMTACSSSTIAIGLAADAIRTGACDLAVTGGADALSRLTFTGFCSLRAVDPERCRPFDRHRKGMSLGESAGILVLEDMERARRRGARIRAELLGYGTACDAHHVTAPDPSGDGASRTMRAALEDAGVAADGIDYISAHGTATQYNDEAETRAIHHVFGARAKQVPVSSIKSMVGHCLGAAGAIEAVALVLTVEQGLLPPTAGLREADPECDLDYVPNTARKAKVNVAVSNSFGFGGQNDTIIVKRFVA